MTAPIALQMYTLREALAKDFAGVIKKVADIGYVGVEVQPDFDPQGTTAEETVGLFKELGLEVSSAQVPLPIGKDQKRVLDYAATVGCKRIVSGKEAESFATIELIKQACDQFNVAHAAAAEYGLALGIHNHWWEFEQVEGRYVYQVMLDYLDPAIFFEIDTYWVRFAGPDPVKVVEELGPRVPLLHIKDGPAIKGKPREPMVAVGEGVLDFPGIVRAAEGTVEWLIVEMDWCVTDMMEAVEKSYQYLVGEGLARGNKG